MPETSANHARVEAPIGVHAHVDAPRGPKKMMSMPMRQTAAGRAQAQSGPQAASPMVAPTAPVGRQLRQLVEALARRGALLVHQRPEALLDRRAFGAIAEPVEVGEVVQLDAEAPWRAARGRSGPGHVFVVEVVARVAPGRRRNDADLLVVAEGVAGTPLRRVSCEMVGAVMPAR